MKKILVIILLTLTSLTMYFMFVWEPGSMESNAGNNSIGEIEEIEGIEEIEEKKSIEREESKAKILSLKKNMIQDDKVKVNKKLETLSTIDLMKVEEAIKEGNIREAVELMRIRMLESDWKSICEIFEKYKEM
ncbi:MAG: hypothetical protein ACRDDY_14615 [Clostridium sp.]|uniref:hypothetical protein n=1 Tax=Clostridium sp. TaxID=1506 RepID=UPI003EE780B5